MKKIIVVTGIIIAIVAIALVLLRVYTKSFSPQETAQFQEGDLNIEVIYCRPFKKEREVFGSLVPYNEVWRTGANEATLFRTNKAITINGKTLKAGEYSLFTIPKKDEWTIILNSETGQWGITFDQKANRQPENDVLVTQAPAIDTNDIFEQFTISFEKMGSEIEMILMWDQTLVVVPIHND